jgi:hypothetical protein
MYAVTHRLEPADLPGAGDGSLRRDARWPGSHVCWGIPLPPPSPPVVAGTTSPTPWVRRSSQAARDVGHPAHPARHDLPRTGDSLRRDTCPWTRCSSRFSDGTVAAWARARRPARSDDATSASAIRWCTRYAPCRPTTRCEPSRRPSWSRFGEVDRWLDPAPHVSEQPGENALRHRLSTGAPRPRCWPRGAAPRRIDGSARHPLSERDLELLVDAPHARVHLPDHRARPRRRHRPGPAPPRCRGAAVDRVGPARGDRPLRGDPRGRDARAPRQPRAWSVQPARAPRRRHGQRLPLARVGRRRGCWLRGRWPTSWAFGSTARAPPGAVRRRWCTPRRRRMSATSSSAGEHVVAGGQHRLGDVGALLQDAIAAVRR